MKALLVKALVLVALSLLKPSKLDTLPPEHKLVHRYTNAAEDCVTAVELELPTASWRVREKYARSLYVWSYYEASWEQNPYGCKPGSTYTTKYGQVRHCTAGGVWEGTNDEGHACGVVQPHVDTIQTLTSFKGVLEPSWTCTAVRKDRVLGYRAALRILLHLETECGSTALAWSAYASTLGCPKLVQQRVKDRCLDGGLTSDCELPKTGDDDKAE